MDIIIAFRAEEERIASLHTSRLADPISSKDSKSQNFTVLSAEPAKQ